MEVEVEVEVEVEAEGNFHCGCVMSDCWGLGAERAPEAKID